MINQIDIGFKCEGLKKGGDGDDRLFGDPRLGWWSRCAECNNGRREDSISRVYRLVLRESRDHRNECSGEESIDSTHVNRRCCGWCGLDRVVGSEWVRAIVATSMR